MSSLARPPENREGRRRNRRRQEELGDGGDYPARHLRSGPQPRPHQHRSEPRHEPIRLRQFPLVYWNRIGRQCYPRATSILWLCDGGGSNSATHDLFKRDLQDLVDDLGIAIRVAHYPSYCSKYNPIERRLFPHITRVCQGMLFDTLETVVGLMRKASTRTGLRTTVNVIRRAYEIGLKVADGFKETMMAAFDKKIPKWNYRAIPQ